LPEIEMECRNSGMYRLLLALSFVLQSPLLAETPWAPFAEPGAWGYCSNVDLRGQAIPQVVVRGIVLRLAGGWCVCFDQDLLRVAAIWQGEDANRPLTEEGIAPKSYQNPKGKADGGSGHLPKPVGKVVFLAEPKPGAWAENTICPPDPRPLCPSEKEAGRGPLPSSWGQFLGRQHQLLKYRVGAAEIQESWTVAKNGNLTRKLVSTGSASLRNAQGAVERLTGELTQVWATGAEVSTPPSPLDLAGEINATITLGPEQDGWHIDLVNLPTANRWKRNVRPSGIDFMSDGTAVFCTIDGDVWKMWDNQRWQRVATGLHEPQSIQAVGERIFCFTRQGIEEILPTGEVSMFCDQFPQGSDTREYPMDMKKRPEGGFFVAKGGQQLSMKGLSAGRIFSVSADGKTVKEYARGLRQPYLGMDPQTGMLTASDQQGHHMPGSPVHMVKAGSYYGFPDAIGGPIPTDVTPPALWFPHMVNQSASGQVWCRKSNMGELSDCFVHMGYFKSTMFKVLLGEKQAAGMPLGLQFPIPLLKSAINPKDGFLYACGLQIWDADAPLMTGVVRLRPAAEAAPRLPTVAQVWQQGIQLTFPTEIDATSLAAANFLVESWDYKRTKQYGSPPYRKDGKTGQDGHPVAAAKLAADGRTVFIRAEHLEPRMNLRVDYRLQTKAGKTLQSFVVFTATELRSFDFAAAGLDPALGTLQAPSMAAVASTKAPASVAEGRKWVEMLGCLACHSTDGRVEGLKAPTWKGLLGQEVELVKGGTKAVIDRAYLQEAILNPPAKVRKGYDNPDLGMPSYQGILTEEKLESVLLYLESLR
jgi:hypothetical protein